MMANKCHCCDCVVPEDRVSRPSKDKSVFGCFNMRREYRAKALAVIGQIRRKENSREIQKQM